MLVLPRKRIFLQHPVYYRIRGNEDLIFLLKELTIGSYLKSSKPVIIYTKAPNSIFMLTFPYDGLLDLYCNM
jgi:hypothetical protein